MKTNLSAIIAFNKSKTKIIRDLKSSKTSTLSVKTAAFMDSSNNLGWDTQKEN